MNIVDYSKSNEQLEVREQRLFDIIKKLEIESNKVFDEVVDLDINSFYKIDNLYKRLCVLSDMCKEVVESYDYLKEIEIEGFVYASRRLHLKRLLAAIVTIYAILNDALLGIMSYLMLNSLANKYFAYEVGEITSKIYEYNRFDLNKISTVIENSKRLLIGKLNRIHEGGIESSVYFANNSIACYLEGFIDEEDILSLDDGSKKSIVSLLQKDLSSTSSDILELLSDLRIRSNNQIKLIKEVNK